MSTELTSGCLADIMGGVEIHEPIVQILGSKKISASEGNERFRLLVSDGKYLHSFAMLATQLNDLHIKGKLVEFSIIRLKKYITSLVNRNDQSEKRVLIILDLTVLRAGEEVGKKLGSPTPLTDEAFTKPKEAGASSSSMASTTSTYDTAKTTKDKKAVSVQGGCDLNEQHIHPIDSLSPYQNKWVIKVRVTSKSGIRTWSNSRGEGKLFSMDLADEGGEIRATAFQQQCDQYYDMIEVDKVYFISKCQLKQANKQYSNLKNDYEMSFTADTVVQECVDDVHDIPQIKYDIVPIAQVNNLEANAIIDILGVCKQTSDVQEFTARASGKELKKREITLVDTSNSSISLTLWGDEALKFNGMSQPILLLKNVRVGEYGGGKNLGTISSTVMKLNPDIPDSHKLRGWFDNGGSDQSFTHISNRSTTGASLSTEWLSFYETKERQLGRGDKPDYFQLKAVVHMIKTTNAVYKACPQPDCNKKVVDQTSGEYTCEKCNSTFPNFKYRLLLNMNIGDWTSNRWVTCFTELGEQILGKSSQEFGEACEFDKELANEMIKNVLFKSFIFKLRTKIEYYADSPRNKIVALSATPINHKEYNSHLIENISRLTGIGKVK